MTKGVLLKRDADGSIYLQALGEEPIYSLTQPKRQLVPFKDVRMIRIRACMSRLAGVHLQRQAVPGHAGQACVRPGLGAH